MSIQLMSALAWLLLGGLGLWLLLEIAVRRYLEWPLPRDFYGSLGREKVPERQAKHGVKAATGPGWVHLGWIADPDRETYRVERRVNDRWEPAGRLRFGSFLTREPGGSYRVWAVSKTDGDPRLLGEATAQPARDIPPVLVPRIRGPWRTLFQPREHGDYVNDHMIYQDAEGHWRLVGITSKGNGDFADETTFAVGVSRDFPPPEGMREASSLADFGELAWAPHVIQHDGTYHMFWSPHKLHQMTSPDGIHWEQHRITMAAPYHRFFRDGMVLQVAESQWLLYATARGRYYSQVDIYQSFDLSEWQYIRTALACSWGSERNSPFASTESPCVTCHEGRYYLSVTYNNNSFFWPGILLLFKIWPGRESYNDTLVFHSDTPYDFGTYRGKKRSPTLLTQLEAHAPTLVRHPETGAWYITTAGWPWVSSLTRGEVAVAPLEWEEI
jgi:hypothetical protein